MNPSEEQARGIAALKANYYGDVNTPTYKFKIGDVVRVANMEVAVTGVFENNTIYEMGGTYFRFWQDVRPVTAGADSLIENEQLCLYYSQAELRSLFYKYYQSGVDMSPEYQRGYEWTQKDKVALIRSVFSNVDIGKFVFIERNWEKDINENRPSGGKMYEILDGKQRLRALIDFYEDRFSLNGVKYSDLCRQDKLFFDRKSIVYAAVSNRGLTRSDVLRYFLFLNQHGKAISESHLNVVRKMLETCE